MKFLLGLIVALFTTTAHAGFEGLNDSVSLKIFNRIDCGLGVDCSRQGNGLFSLKAGAGAAATFVDSDLTPDVSGGLNFETGTTGATLTDFDGSDIYEGQIITVVSKGAIVFDVTSSGIVGGTTNIITATGDVTRFMYDGADWLVLSRIDASANLN